VKRVSFGGQSILRVGIGGFCFVFFIGWVGVKVLKIRVLKKIIGILKEAGTFGEYKVSC
jgi:hypothetical protein